MILNRGQYAIILIFDKQLFKNNFLKVTKLAVLDLSNILSKAF